MERTLPAGTPTHLAIGAHPSTSPPPPSSGIVAVHLMMLWPSSLTSPPPNYSDSVLGINPSDHTDYLNIDFDMNC